MNRMVKLIDLYKVNLLHKTRFEKKLVDLKTIQVFLKIFLCLYLDTLGAF